MADLIDRQEALKELAAYIHLIDKTMGKGTLTDDDCMKAAKSVLGEGELSAVQPETNCSEIPNGSDDTISRRAAIDALARMMPRSYTPDGSHPADEEIFRAQEVIADCIEALEILSPVQPDNQTNLCDSCDCSYPDCPSKYDDVIFGNGIGNDNICACNKYKPSAQPEQRWVPCSERLPEKNCRCLTTNEAWGSFEVDWNAWIDGQWLYPNEKPIAWMPLPEPYRGGEQDDR